jgi:hypothetical protein
MTAQSDGPNPRPRRFLRFDLALFIGSRHCYLKLKHKIEHSVLEVFFGNSPDRREIESEHCYTARAQSPA